MVSLPNPPPAVAFFFVIPAKAGIQTLAFCPNPQSSINSPPANSPMADCLPQNIRT